MEQRLASIIGAGCRAKRQQLDLNQSDVAERVGIAGEVYGRLERGHMLPSVRSLRKLCLVLNVSGDALMGLTVPSAMTESERNPAVDSPEIRRINRTLRRLKPVQLRLISQVAGALRR